MNNTTFCVEAVSDYFYSHLGECEDFGEHLDYCATEGRSLLRQAFTTNLHRLDDELTGQVPKPWRIVDMRKRTIITLLGEITYNRRVYEDEYGSRRYLLDEVLGVGRYQRYEKSAFLWIVGMAANVSYRKTVQAFLERTGVLISHVTVMNIVHAEGELLAQKGLGLNKDQLSIPVVFIEDDGFYVPIQSATKKPAQPRRTYLAQFKKKSTEFKVCVAYAGKDKNRRLSPVHWASDAAGEDFFSECLSRIGESFEVDDADYVLIGSDGATWCKNHNLDMLLKPSMKVISKLDVYHINRKVYQAFSTNEDRSQYLGYLYSRNFGGFFEALGKRMEDEPDDPRHSKRSDLLNYIESNLDWLECICQLKSAPQYQSNCAPPYCS